MSYIIPPPPSRGLGPAIGVGVAVAIGSAFLAGLIGGETNSQFAYAAVGIGFLVGLAMRQFQRDSQTSIASALISLGGAALSSVIALTVHLVKAAQIPLSIVLGHISTVVSDVPHYIGAFGFLCWAIAAYVGWATVSGRGRRGRRMRWGTGSAGRVAEPYGTPPGQGQPPYGTAPDPQAGYTGQGFTNETDQAPGTGPDQWPGA